MSGQQPSQSEQDPALAERPTVVVGIGASAGGLAALKEFLATISTSQAIAYVVVVHLSPDHASHLADLLQAHCPLPVQQVTEDTQLEADRVYVIPPGANLSAIDSHLRLSNLEHARARRAPIDHFFRTLAEMHDGHSVGVVLTGTGTDGTLGLRHVKDRRGLTIAQDPTEAEYDGMPRSAIASGAVDLVLPLGEIARAIERFARGHPSLDEAEDAQTPTETDDSRVLQKIYAQLRARTGHDFSQYKRSTILRRIARRMAMHEIRTHRNYLALLREKNDEVVDLFNDLLITVTEFFRDTEVYKALEKDVVPRLLEGKGAGDHVRVWSVGCSTGEEAYSIAMLLIEAVDRAAEENNHAGAPTIQVFASDLHPTALERAREGLYPSQIAADVSPERLRRFFQEEDGQYRVRRELRERVVFAPHNLLSDPPFSHLDLVLCRNVMIYLQRDVQDDVAALFHYALKDHAFLVLGASETMGRTELFECTNKDACVYRKRTTPTRESSMPSFPFVTTTGSPRSAEGPAPRPPSRTGYGGVHERMVERYAPPSILLNARHEVVHTSSSAARYLRVPGGESTRNVFKLVRDCLAVELRALVHAAAQSKAPARGGPITVDLDGKTHCVSLWVRPASDPELDGYVLVVFEEHSPAGPRADENAHETEETDETESALVRDLRAELRVSRQHLQSAIDGYESNREQMEASNQDLQSANEELRSTLEELETSKEELQSLNEELATINQENRNRVEELAQLSNDLHNLLTATDIATIFLDRDLRIVRFTPRAGELFNIRPSDRGRPLSDLNHRLGYDTLREDARSVLEQFTPVEHEIKDQNGRHYLARILPYRAGEDRVDGVVLTLVDTTELHKASEDVRRARVYAESIVETIHEPLLVLTPELTVRTANEAFCKNFQVSRNETIGRRIYDLGNGQWDIPGLRTLLEEVLPHDNIFNDFEVEHEFETLGRRIMLVNARRLDHVQYILLGIRDITEKTLAQRELRASEARLRAMVNVPGVGVLIFETDGTLIDANDAFLQTSGYTREDIDERRLTWHSLTPPEFAQESDEQLRNLAATGHIGPYEKMYFLADGSRSWMLFAGADLGDGTIAEYCIDISDRKRAEQELQTSRQRLAGIYASARVGISEITKDGRFITVNDELCRIMGRTRHELLDLTIADVTHPDDMPETLERIRQLLQNGEPISIDKRYRHPDGTVIHANSTASLLKGSDPPTMVVVTSDLTERQRAELAMRASEARLRALVTATSDVVYRMSPDWTRMLRLESKDFLEEHGPPTSDPDEEAPGDPDEPWIQRYIPKGERPRVHEAIDRAQADKSVFELEHRVIRADGTTGWTYSRAVPLIGDDGDIIEWFGAATDVTARKQAQDALRESEERYRLLVESAREYAMILLDPDGRVVSWNSGAQRMFGYTAEEVHGQPTDFLYTEEDRAQGVADAEMRRARHEGAATDDRWHRRKDGSRFWANGVMTTLDAPADHADDHGAQPPQLRGFVKVLRDQTRQKAHDEQLKTIMAELNHRVKNTLAVVQSIASQTMHRATSLEGFRGDFERRLRSIGKAHSLLSRTSWSGAALKEIIESELGASDGAAARVRVSGPEVTLPPHTALAMHMVLHELATNAHKYGALASPEGALDLSWTIDEQAEDRPLTLEWCERCPDPIPEPSTEGFGTRLIQQLIAYELKGSVDRRFESHGVRCRLRVPIKPREAPHATHTEAPSDTDAPDAEPAAEPDARPTVLLIEDLAPLALAMKEELEHRGFRVVGPASTLAQAQTLARSLASSLAAVKADSTDNGTDTLAQHCVAVLDVNLGDEQVYPLIPTLEAAGVPIILLTGHEATSLPDEARHLPVLSKPVDLEDLERFIREHCE